MAPRTDVVFIELGELLRRICEHPLPELSPETLVEDIPGIDSLRLLQAVALLEEHFDVEINIAALDYLVTVGDIANAVIAARPA